LVKKKEEDSRVQERELDRQEVFIVERHDSKSRLIEKKSREEPHRTLKAERRGKARYRSDRGH